MARAGRSLRGTGIGQGVVIARVLRMPDPIPEPVTLPSSLSFEEERERTAKALRTVAAELSERGALAGGTAREVLDAQSIMTTDPAIEADVNARLARGMTGERATHEAFAAFREVLCQLGGYMAERASDLEDISRRVIAELAGLPAPGVPDSETPFILVAQDLAPADTALLNLDKVIGLITAEGGPTSHTAILAREKSIAALVGAEDALQLVDGDEVILDAANNLAVVDPDARQRTEAEARRAAYSSRREAPVRPGTLADGTAVSLLANLGSADGAARAVELGAEGVGLFRTEFLFLERGSAPTVAQQEEIYTRLLRSFPGMKVVVRVLDAGADKPLSFLNGVPEENPALGRRGLRALRKAEGILRDQLRALANADAATDADLWVMAPMVATVGETEYFVKIAREYGLKTAGVMVEIPAAALLADRVLARADFVSIGTNDLTQYTMAADRMLGSLAALQDPWHPAVLRLIAMTGEAGKVNGKPVGICGEAAADPLLAVVLVGLGATSLSMSASALADVRISLASHSLDEARDLARIALAADDAATARAAVSAAATDS